ncbi:MAG: nickel-type superoxide dismutase maturation protease [Candidatus Yanofskybacteria bacterium]|nr:nickel-type superoxide dismutase maturation protease [Candidatus Yanofskybacteria bacterium]
MFSYFHVQGQSMEPFCREGDFVLVNRMSYLLSHPCVGDVVVFSDPARKDFLLVKRVARISRGGLVWVEGDNTQGSYDSRTFGWIPRKAILGKGKVIHRSLPLAYDIMTQSLERSLINKV